MYILPLTGTLVSWNSDTLYCWVLLNYQEVQSYVTRSSEPTFQMTVSFNPILDFVLFGFASYLTL